MTLLVVFVIQACDTMILELGNGDTIVRTVSVDDFDEVFLNGNYEVFLEKGENSQIVIKTDENLQDFIEVEGRNNTLSVRNTKRIKGSDGIKLFITYVELDKLVCGGASKVYTTSPLVQDKLELSMSGAGVMDLEMEVQDLDIQLSGAGLISLEGIAERQEINLTGAGSLEAFELESEDCEISISGVGGAELNVSRKLTARISGMGGIQYTGDPEDIRREISGIGKITKAD